MRTASVIAGIAFMVLATGNAGVTFAQTPAPADSTQDSIGADMLADIELTRAAIQVRRQALVTAIMDLEAKEADAFWPLYRDYRLAMAKVNDRFVKLVVTYLQKYDALTDADAGRMLNESLGIERARNDLKKKYVSRFREALPARKVARFFQADNKLDAIINAELATLIPLAR